MPTDPVASADRLILVLRKKLEERAKSAAGGRREEARVSGQTSQGTQDVHRIAAASGASERQLRRRFLQNILAEEFGHELVNDAPFQQMVEKVSAAIEGDPGTAALLGRVIAELEG